MWTPESADELERAPAKGGLEESATFDGKRELGTNEDIVVDICAMTPEGGMLVYGAGENRDKTRLTEAYPVALAAGRQAPGPPTSAATRPATGSSPSSRLSSCRRRASSDVP